MIPINTDVNIIIFGVVNRFVYTNHNGEVRLRRVIPMGLRFGTGPYYDEPQWLLEGFDLDKKEYRTFALAHIAIEQSKDTSYTPYGGSHASNRETESQQQTDRPKQDRESTRPDNPG